jgi:hypothetical protein
MIWIPQRAIRGTTRAAQFGLNFVGDTFRGIFHPKSWKMPRNVNWKEKYEKTGTTRNTFRGTGEKKEKSDK